MNKKELRKIIKLHQSALTAEYKQLAAVRITEKVIASPQYRQAETVLLFLSMDSEPDTSGMLGAAFAAGKRVCVPKCCPGHVMKAIAIDSLDELKPQPPYGLLEPVSDAGEVRPDQVDLVIVPCMAASMDGRRLGHGAGYYDRFLAQTGAYKLCICFGALLSDEIPMDSFDMWMDAVVTEESDV